jgi:2-keto-3-deoxy-L-rhamnonate aldolase RhmA
MQPTFRARLLAREPMIATLITLPAPELAEVCADAGFDWLFLDAEHGSLDLPAIQRIAQASGDRCPLVVRVPAIEDVWIKKVMDAGVAGLMIPQVNSALDAAAAVRRSKFPPSGVRGVGVARANRYGASLPEYLAQADKNSAVIVQVEHIDAVRNVEQILDTDGVDAIFVGPYDLSASMGRAGRVDDPEVQAAIARVRQVCTARKYPIGIFANDAAGARQALDQGFTLIAVGAEVTLLSGAARQVVQAFRSR